MVKPTYVGKNPEYFVNPFNEMAEHMANDFDELLTAKGFTIRGPYGSRDEMVYEAKINSSFILEIGIELSPQYNRKYNTLAQSPSFTQMMVDKNAPQMNGKQEFMSHMKIKIKPCIQFKLFMMILIYFRKVHTNGTKKLRNGNIKNLQKNNND